MNMDRGFKGENGYDRNNATTRILQNDLFNYMSC